MSNLVDIAHLRIGTRGSPLALAQAKETARRIDAAWAGQVGAMRSSIEVISTEGDRVQDRELSEIGGKGLFTRELDAALLDGRIEIAVHSMKDVPTVLPDGVSLVAVLPREDVRDALISPDARSLDDLPRHAVVGTSSLRRGAQLRHRRPDLSVVGFRGNVQTRLRKLAEGRAAATFLAVAGLKRLGAALSSATPIAPEDMLPAVAQGAIGVCARSGDAAVQALLEPLSCGVSAARIEAERAFLRRLDGSCRTPIAGLAEIDGDRLRLRGEILATDGSASHSGVREGTVADGARMGVDLAEELLAEAGPGFLG